MNESALETHDIHIFKSLFNEHIHSVKNKYNKIMIEYFEKHKTSISEFDMTFVNQFIMSSVKKYKNFSNALLFKHNDNQIIFNIIFNESIDQVITYLSKKMNFSRVRWILFERMNLTSSINMPHVVYLKKMTYIHYNMNPIIQKSYLYFYFILGFSEDWLHFYKI